MDRDESPPLSCARCGTSLQRGSGGYYVVQITAVADPTPPWFSEEDLERDPAPEIDRLLARLRGQSEEELMDQVYRREILVLCTACYQHWIANPVGA